jgi:hypothetical protein
MRVFWRGRRAVSGSGYALLVGLIAVTALLTIASLGSTIAELFNGLFDDAAAVVDDGGTTPPEAEAPGLAFSSPGLILRTGVPPEAGGTPNIREVTVTASGFSTPAASLVFGYELTSADLDPLPALTPSGSGAIRVLSLSIDGVTQVAGTAQLLVTVTGEGGESAGAALPVTVTGFVNDTPSGSLGEPDVISAAGGVSGPDGGLGEPLLIGDVVSVSTSVDDFDESGLSGAALPVPWPPF